VLTDGKGQPVLGLLSSPYIDTQVFQFLGTNVATTVAGNAFFNPFLWDGVHYFALTYDSQGRAESAQERDVDNLLRFRWDGNRLAEITGFHKGSTTPYYKRAIVYTAGQIDREDYTIDGRQGHIDYSYNNKVLREIKVEQDGKTWVVRPR
jgi:hypothetical protein